MTLKATLVSSFILSALAFTAGAVVYGQVYYVQPGDSLYSIAARYGTTIATLTQANGISNNAIYPGQALNIHSKGSASSAGFSNFTYTVLAGDSLFLIAQKFGVTMDAIKSSNNLSSEYLWTGKQIMIPSAKNNSSSTASRYLVQAGDSIFLIAKRYGVSAASLRAANNLSSDAMIYPNQSLTIPKATTSTSSSSSGLQLSQNDMDLLARLVSAESDGEPFAGQVAVAATILNRLRDPLYPKTIAGIIYQVDNGRYQYSPVLDGRINQSASATAYRAIQLACSGWDPSNGANGFYNPSKTGNKWVESQPVTVIIGNHIFFNS